MTMVEEAERQGRLDHRRGPGFARSPCVLLYGDPRAHPRIDAGSHRSWSTSAASRPHDFDHLPGRRRSRSRACPFIRLHETVAGLVAPSRVVAIALNTYSDRGRGGGAATSSPRDRARDRDLPAPTIRCGSAGPGCGGAIQRGAGRPGVSLGDPDTRCWSCALRDPIPSSPRSEHGAGRYDHDGDRRAAPRQQFRRRRDRRGLSRPVLRRDADAIAAIFPHLVAALRRRRIRRRPAWPGQGSASSGAIALERRGEYGTIDIALHDLVGKAAGPPVHGLLGLSAEIPPTDFTIGSTSPSRRGAGRPGRPLSGAEDQGRRPGRRRDAARRSGGLRRADPRRRQHGWRPTTRGAGARACRARRRARRAAIPRGSLDELRRLQEGRRCRSSPTSSA